MGLGREVFIILFSSLKPFLLSMKNRLKFQGLGLMKLLSQKVRKKLVSPEGSSISLINGSNLCPAQVPTKPFSC